MARVLLNAGADANDTIRPPRGVPSQVRGYGGAPPFGASVLLLAAANAHYELAASLLEAGGDNVKAVGRIGAAGELQAEIETIGWKPERVSCIIVCNLEREGETYETQ